MTFTEDTDKLLIVLAAFIADNYSSGYVQKFKYNATTYNLIVTDDVVAILDNNMSPVNRIFVKDIKEHVRFS